MNAAEIEELLIKLVQIPAPTGREQKRAEYITDWLKELGYHPFTDAAGNVIVEMKVQEGGYTVLMAHMDTVFEDVDISVVKNANILSAPGIGDDTCNAAFLMAVMKTLIGQKCRPLKNLLFVFDTGEEGLGNCRGTRQLMQDYKDKVDEVISFDLGSDAVCVKAVGSKRYRVTVTAPGGHSFHAFGQKGAIETAAEIIHEIYRIKPCEGTQTTYNVGMIEGGTSVNTIAQKCTFLAEVRSDDAQALQKIDGQLCNIFDFFNNAEGFAKVQISYELTVSVRQETVYPKRHKRHLRIRQQKSSAGIRVESRYGAVVQRTAISRCPWESRRSVSAATEAAVRIQDRSGSMPAHLKRAITSY